ncbi:MAG: GGDEF domain-containing protein [Lysobacteraceae bacterium]
MSTLRQTLHELSSTLRDRPDEIVLDIGAGGELLVARFRVAATLLLMLMPLANLATGGGWFESLAGFAGTGIGLALALVWLKLARHKRRYSWLSFATSASDVTMETLVLIIIGTQSPAASVNTLIVFSCYLLSIFTTALRNDGRVTLFTGLLAMLQYGLLVCWVFSQVAAGEVLASADYGTVSLGNQIQRMLLLLVVTLLTAIVVYRIQRLVLLSGTDTLTGLPNRSYLMHRVPQLLGRARKDDGSITLAIIDLDHFKRINDEFGHPVGDRALKHVVQAVQAGLRPGETLMRVGGEEFVLLLPVPMAPAWERMESLRKQVAAIPFLPDEESDGHATHPQLITFSAGLANMTPECADVSSLMRLADQRLRRAKQTGRNQVVARD